MAKRGLYANIHAKRRRIKKQKARGAKKVERMRSKRSKYAPSAKAFKQAAKKANPILMEPIMSVEVTTPDEFTGGVTGDLNKRRGIMKGMDMKGNSQIIKADVPLSELFGYVTDLRTLSSGRASASLTFSHYTSVPKNIAEGIISKSNGEIN